MDPDSGRHRQPTTGDSMWWGSHKLSMKENSPWAGQHLWRRWDLSRVFKGEKASNVACEWGGRLREQRLEAGLHWTGKQGLVGLGVGGGGVGVGCCHLLSSHYVLGTGGYSIYLTQSSCISRVLCAKEGPGERDINRKWTGSKNKHRGRVDPRVTWPRGSKMSWAVSFCFSALLSTDSASFWRWFLWSHNGCQNTHASLFVTNWRSWLPGALTKEQESFFTGSPGKPLSCFTGPTWLRFVHSWTNYWQGI